MRQKVLGVINRSKRWKIVKFIRRHCHLRIKIIYRGRREALRRNNNNRTHKLCVIRDLSKRRSKDLISVIAVTPSIPSALTSSINFHKTIIASLSNNTASLNPTATAISSNRKRRLPRIDPLPIICFSPLTHNNKLEA